MTNLSQPSPGPTANPTALATEWILLNSGCEDLMSYEEWCERRTAARVYVDTWAEEERTEFWYATAQQACTDPRLVPTPGLRMTPENMAREFRRLDKIVYALDDGHDENPPWNWLVFVDPLMATFTVGECWRYAHERMRLAYGFTEAERPCVLPDDPDVKLTDFFPLDDQGVSAPDVKLVDIFPLDAQGLAISPDFKLSDVVSPRR